MSKKTFGLYIVLIAMAVITIILAIVILVITDDKDKDKEDRHINEETRAVNQSEVEETYDYVLRYERQSFRIYRNITDENREVFYDYADINVDNLPKDIKDRLVNGIHFKGEAELYDFLQTYSS